MIHFLILFHSLRALATAHALVHKLPCQTVHSPSSTRPWLHHRSYLKLEIETSNWPRSQNVLINYLCLFPKSSEQCTGILSLLLKPLPLTNLHSTSHCNKPVKHGEEKMKLLTSPPIVVDKWIGYATQFVRHIKLHAWCDHSLFWDVTGWGCHSFSRQK